MRDAMQYTLEMLNAFKPKDLKQLGLDVALEKEAAFAEARGAT
jgi:hypothetical protein